MKRALLALVLVACSKPAPQAEPAPAPVPAPPAVVAPARHEYTGHMADMSGGVLHECADVSVLVTPPGDAGADWKPKADPLEKFAKDTKRTSIPKPCAEQFTDRTALASCSVSSTATAKTGEAYAVTVRTTFYDVADVGNSDAKMAECLESKGEWKALPKDSPEFRKARLEHSRKRLEKAVDGL
jgi:hypothetical protein